MTTHENSYMSNKLVNKPLKRRFVYQIRTIIGKQVTTHLLDLGEILSFTDKKDKVKQSKF